MKFRISRMDTPPVEIDAYDPKDAVASLLQLIGDHRSVVSVKKETNEVCYVTVQNGYEFRVESKWVVNSSKNFY